MLNACAESNGFAVMGGGHTATLVMQRGLEEKMGHVSTGGGNLLGFHGRKVLRNFVLKRVQSIPNFDYKNNSL